MTARDLYNGVLIELLKENAPNIILEDFNYFANKSVLQFVNKRYNIYDVNQQTTDDLRVLKSTTVLADLKLVLGLDMLTTAGESKMATYEVELPSDYLHLLNCICIYKVNKTFKCYNKGLYWRAAATRLTADSYSLILDNYWLKPTYKRPYYYIHNINTQVVNPTNPCNDSNLYGTDLNAVKSTDQTDAHEASIVEGSFQDSATAKPHILLRTGTGTGKETRASLVEKTAQVRYGNPSRVRMEIRYGTDNTIFELDKVLVDYIKTPLHIRLTLEQIDRTEDTSLILEFPDYVNQEILNELVHIIMEHISDPRILTHPVVSLSIANPTQQLAPAAGGQSA